MTRTLIVVGSLFTAGISEAVIVRIQRANARLQARIEALDHPPRAGDETGTRHPTPEER